MSATVFAEQGLSHAAKYSASKYEVRGRLVRGGALWQLGRRQEAEKEVVAADLAERLGYPTWARRAWSTVATLTRSPRCGSRADAAISEVAEGLDRELRDRFLRLVVRSA